ncbi:hypothetical protein H257_16212 [Aphanomyces astaci]|uniref:Uncharacterized protein n=2 Tax=Aphanomyces astaci TaxID=112090 RepID=W4FJH0_APHAT|nr:hypothetical protein H257_16212 [Aphanomyces astaci]ETV67615.1 hypothetical protein H257_16212 [Aphanomyces astaci]|eukprot:XP_009842872.1 hypothetical protein H257_16212 [Aphanomyces astaci]
MLSIADQFQARRYRSIAVEFDHLVSSLSRNMHPFALAASDPLRYETLNDSRTEGVVFFGGAVRLGPACGGSGALVMPTASLCYVCEYETNDIPAATTNNQAEDDGLVRSLCFEV